MLNITQTDEVLSRLHAIGLTAATPAEVRAAADEANAAEADWLAACAEFGAALTAALGHSYDWLRDGDYPDEYAAAAAIITEYSGKLTGCQFGSRDAFSVKAWRKTAKQHRNAARKVRAAMPA